MYGIGEKRIKIVINDDFEINNIDESDSEKIIDSSENASHVKTLNSKNNTCNNFEDIY